MRLKIVYNLSLTQATILSDRQDAFQSDMSDEIREFGKKHKL